MNNNRNNQRKKKPVNKKENEHIPRYIKSQPWFYNDDKKKRNPEGEFKEDEKEEDKDYLIHHRQTKKGNALDIDNNAEPKVGVGILDTFQEVIISKFKEKFTEGKNNKLCQNCGSVGHLQRDCLERPKKIRKNEVDPFTVSTKTGRSTDGVVISVRDGENNGDWDAKQDRWFGYSGKEYEQVLKKWEDDKLDNGNKNNNEKREWDTDEEIELTKLGLYKDDVGELKMDDSNNSELTRASVRLREDKASYLNDVHSSEIKYDPKSRIYKSDDLGTVDEKTNMFRRHLTGEGLQLTELNKFVRENAKKSGIKDEVEDPSKIDHVLVANPTKYEQMLQSDKIQEEADASKKVKLVQFKDLEATKLTGSLQSKKAREELRDLYA